MPLSVNEAWRLPRKLGVYASDRKERLGIEADDNPFHTPTRKVKNKSNSLINYTPFKGNFRKWIKIS